MLSRTLQRLCLFSLIVPAVFSPALYSSFAKPIPEALKERKLSIVNPAVDTVEQFTLIGQEHTDGSETTPQVDDEETSADKSEIAFSIWAAAAAVLGFGFGGLLALRARGRAKAEKAE